MEIKCKNCWANHAPGTSTVSCGCICHQNGGIEELEKKVAEIVSAPKNDGEKEVECWKNPDGSIGYVNPEGATGSGKNKIYKHQIKTIPQPPAKERHWCSEDCECQKPAGDWEKLEKIIDSAIRHPWTDNLPTRTEEAKRVVLNKISQLIEEAEADKNEAIEGLNEAWNKLLREKVAEAELGGAEVKQQFFSAQIAQARQNAFAEIESRIEEYFKGLIMIPDPQLTKESLLSFIKENKTK